MLRELPCIVLLRRPYIRAHAYHDGSVFADRKILLYVSGLIFDRISVNHGIDRVGIPVARPLFDILINIFLPVVVIRKTGERHVQSAVNAFYRFVKRPYGVAYDIAPHSAPVVPERVRDAEACRGNSVFFLKFFCCSRIVSVILIIVFLIEYRERISRVVDLYAENIVILRDFLRNCCRERQNLAVCGVKRHRAAVVAVPALVCQQVFVLHGVHEVVFFPCTVACRNGEGGHHDDEPYAVFAARA